MIDKDELRAAVIEASAFDPFIAGADFNGDLMLAIASLCLIRESGSEDQIIEAALRNNETKQ